VVAGKLSARIYAIPRDDSPPGRGVDHNELLADRVPAGEPHVNARQYIVLVAVDQSDAVSDRRVERGAEVVGINDRGQMTEALGQRDRLIPGEEFALLDVDV